MDTKPRDPSPADVIRDRRLNRDKPLRQREVADKIGVDPITVSRWERGVTTPSDIHRVLLARALGGSPSDYEAAA